MIDTKLLEERVKKKRVNTHTIHTNTPPHANEHHSSLKQNKFCRLSRKEEKENHVTVFALFYLYTRNVDTHAAE